MVEPAKSTLFHRLLFSGEKMTITSVEKSTKNKDRLAVYVDGQFSFTISEEDYVSLNLYDKTEISPEEIDHIKNGINYRAAKSTAVRFVSLKLRSEKEVYAKLESEGFDPGTIRKAIKELKSMGYINDKIYAQKYVFDRSKLKPKAKRLLKFELESKGISGDIADEVLAGWEIDEVTVAEGLIRRKYGKYDLKDPKVLSKVKAFLFHRGFNYSVIENAINNYMSENQ